jgi:hypothetical protein
MIRFSVRSALVAGAVSLTALTGAASTDIDSELEAAKALYREAKFGQAIARLQTVIGRIEELRDAQARRMQLPEAYLHLALAHFALDDPAAAKESLKQLLRLDRGRVLDPQIYAPQLVALFEEARAEVAREPLAPSSPVPATPPAAERGDAKKGGGRLPVVLLGAAGAAGAGIALANGGGGGAAGGAATPPPSSTPPASAAASIELVAASPPSGATLTARSEIVFLFRYTVQQDVCFHVRLIDTAGNPCIGVALTRPPASNGATELRVSTGPDTRWASCLEPTVRYTRADVSLDLPASCPGSGQVTRLVERSWPVEYTITR